MIADPAGFRPELLRDKYWADIIPKQIPYTKALEQLRIQIFCSLYTSLYVYIYLLSKKIAFLL
jgi:hypothetical protein